MHNSHNLANALSIIGSELRKAKDQGDSQRIALANKAYGAMLALITLDDSDHLGSCYGMVCKVRS